jgi:hypothetical protein
MTGLKDIYIDRIKQETIQTLDGGGISDPYEQYAFINSQIQKLLLTNDDRILKTTKKYFEEQDKLMERKKNLDNEVLKIMDEYAENCIEIYKFIKTL